MKILFYLLFWICLQYFVQDCCWKCIKCRGNRSTAYNGCSPYKNAVSKSMDGAQNIPYLYILCKRAAKHLHDFFYKHHFFKQHLAKLTIKQRLSKTLRRNKCVCFNRTIWLIVMRIRRTMKNWSHRYHINRPRPTHGHKYTKYKIYHDKMMAVCIEHHLFSIWSSIHDKVKKRTEKRCYYKKTCIW